MMLNVPVMHLLSLPPSIVTGIAPFSTRVELLVGTNFSSVWSIFMITEPRILCFSIVVTISWWKRNSISHLAPSGILTFNNAFIQWTHPIHLNKLFVQLDVSMSMFPTALGYFWMRALLWLWLDLNSQGHHESLLPWYPWYMIEPSHQVHQAQEDVLLVLSVFSVIA